MTEIEHGNFRANLRWSRKAKNENLKHFCVIYYNTNDDNWFY